MPTVIKSVTTEWLSLEQLCDLLTSGELVVTSGESKTKLFVHFVDRAAALKLAAKFHTLHKSEFQKKEENES